MSRRSSLGIARTATAQGKRARFLCSLSEM
jgi:hypothetical protein